MVGIIYHDDADLGGGGATQLHFHGIRVMWEVGAGFGWKLERGLNDMVEIISRHFIN